MRLIAATIAFGLTIGALAACTGSASGRHSGRSGVAASSTDSTQSSPIGTEALYAYFPATGAQYAIGARYRGTVGNLGDRALYPCMAKSGFDLGPIPSAQSVALSDFDNSQYPDLRTIAQTGALVPPGVAPDPAPPPTASASYIAAYTAALHRCGTNSASQALLSVLNKNTLSLAQQWMQKVSLIEASAGAERLAPTFESCTEQSGMQSQYFVGTSSADLMGSFLAWTQGEESKAAGAAQQAVAQQHWATVFVRCATPMVRLLEQEQLAAQKIFFQEHYQQILVIQHDAAHLVSSLASGGK